MNRLPILTVLLITAACPFSAAADSSAPTALVLEFADPWTQATGLADALRDAGVRVGPLPLDRSPLDADVDMICIGSFAAEDPRYREYMDRFAEGLRGYVDHGHLLVQFTQADQTESTPPFLPTTQDARRCDDDAAAAVVLSAAHPLLTDIEIHENRVQFSTALTVWEGFNKQGGFEVILAADEEGRFPALMEGAHGRGRILLSALPIDKRVISKEAAVDAEWDSAREAFRSAFFRNLAAHALAVRDRTAPAIRVTVSPRDVRGFAAGSWTLAVLPDTQIYSQRFPGLFIAQTGWVREHRDDRSIRYVLQLGDIVNNNTEREWRNARTAFRLLDGVVPYALAPGNHDYGPSGSASTRETRFNEFFPFDECTAWSEFGGAMEPGRLDNTFHRFEAGGRKWIIVALEWAPRDETVAWANEVMTAHPDHLGILITHAYLNNNDRRYDHTDGDHPQDYNPHNYRTPGSKNDGEQLWQKLVRRHDFAFVLNGHVLGDGAGYLASTNDAGRVVHQILSNYQMRTLGGEAYLRLLEFQPDGHTILVKTYSPLYDRYMLDPAHQFTLELRRD